MTERPYGVRRSSSWRSRARWFLRAHPADYTLVLIESYAAIPLIGRYFEPIGGLAAISAWGYRHVPNMVSAAVRSRLAPGASETRREELRSTTIVAELALKDIVSEEDLCIEWPVPDETAPIFRAAQHRRQYLFKSSVRYGVVAGQLLDVWRRKDLPPGPAPVMVFVPGGAWVHGNRLLQGYALLSHLAERGWVCLSIDYRVAPHHRWPHHMNDVKSAVAWARAHVDEFGGDREFVAIVGCSAGGHLAALAGLTPDDRDLHVELSHTVDTSVDAVVGMYGRYDWEDRSTYERDRFVDFLERVVVKRTQKRNADLFRAASPIARVRPDAPPFLIVHGTADTIIPVAQARAFVERLRATSRSIVGYLELPGGHHGFDMTDGPRTAVAATVIGLFLDHVYRTHHPAERKKSPTQGSQE